ncbi:hypothetical protein VFPPC_14223 [Pochonia chlamydosporia 170]|uniref:Uncharacterized protein n=1 Tax=Pochonia chlamydosporia 170 TaxID=1380566 RepID=A0A179F8Z8_METCM|nr:hypothetical protein VFPPC_14223 [Pochonia chlamydosporia 170]OAQ61912.1 hypothetical protein VFPPC_14223 [Pochonia chlamydosporia 170]
MKTALVLLTTAVAAVSAAPNGGIPPGTQISCSKANGKFCLDATTIVDCDANAVGTRSNCNDVLAAYPPAGRTALCWQSGPQAFDAVCQKSCVVYTPKQSTLAADKCTAGVTPTLYPTGTQTGTSTGTRTGTSTGTASQPSGTTQTTPSNTSKTGVVTIPEGTGTRTSLGTATVPTTSPSKLTSTGTWSPTESDECPAPTASSTATGKPGNTTAPPGTKTTSKTTTPTAGANANHAVGALAAAGFLAAFLF